ncbi:pilin [Acinetobacter sp. MD2]|uniref:pilin n=1 Tax=Acinetobacter sp. MD2 TaxID=2600066 RepID=UPI002D1F0D9F|nr:pilin [Acinetobacter sp. MD2]MEB3767267.1 pilin [Acinetobacter sp. MD2]
MIVVAIIGILAAIAIPQYQNYVGRSNVAAAVQTVAANKTGVESFVMENGAFPDGTTAAAEAKGTAGQEGYVAAVTGQTPAALGIVTPTFGTIALQKGTNGAGNIVLTFTTGNPGIKDKHVQWHRDANGTWTCESDVDEKFVGKSCVYKATVTAAS